MTTSRDSIDIITLRSGVGRSLPRLVMLTVAAGIATFMVLAMVAPRYSAQAQIALVANGMPSDRTSDGHAFEAIGVGIGGATADPHLRQLRSPRLAAAVADKLNLAGRKEFDPALGSLDLVDAGLRLVGIGEPPRGESQAIGVLRTLLGNLDVHAARDSELITIRFTSVDPELAADVANTIAETYQEMLARDRAANASPTEKALDSTIAHAPMEGRTTGIGRDSPRSQSEAIHGTPADRAIGVEARLVTPAQASATPDYPRKGPFAALVSAATFLFGLALVVTRSLLTGARRVRSAGAPSQRTTVCNDRLHQASSVPSATAPVPSLPAQLHEPLDPIVRSVEVLATMLLDNSVPGTGFRTLITGASLSDDPVAIARALAEALSEDGTHVLLVDWSPSGGGLAAHIDESEGDGMAEVIDGSASFETAIHLIPGSRVHGILPGHDLPAYPGTIEADRINLVLDALDEAYDHIIVVARQGPARLLFEAIEGRFDAGVLIGQSCAQRPAPRQKSAKTFLGFHVEGLLVVHYEPADPASARLQQRRALPREAAPAQ